MTIISILNPKGGSGKTTLSINLTRSLQKRGHSVLLVDSDPQGSARDWHAVREEPLFPLVAIDRANNFKTLSNIAATYNFSIIDGAAKLEDIITATIKVSDIILIPVQPSPFDIWAAADLVELIKTRQELTEGKPKAAFMINRAVKGTKLSQEITDTLSEFGFTCLNSSILQRQIYPQQSVLGLTVYEGTNREAIAEMESLTHDLLLLNEELLVL